MPLYDSELTTHGSGQITTKIINGVECIVYIPSNVTADTDVSIYFPGGSGGASTVGKGTTAQEYLQNMNPDSIVILPGSYSTDMNIFSEGLIDYADELANNYGLNSHQYATCSFSYGSVPHSAFLEYQLKNHPETVPGIIGYIDSFKDGGYNDSGVNAFTGMKGDPANLYKLLADNDKTVVYFGRVGISEIRKPFREMMNAGVNFVYAKPNSGHTGHVGAEEAAMNINMIDFLNGNFSTLLESKSGYTFYKYDPSTGKAPANVSELTEMTYDEVFDLYVEQGVLPGLYSIDDLMKVDEFNIETIDSDMKLKYSNLLGLGNYTVKLPSNATPEITSSVSYVTTFVNKMRSQIRNTSFLKTFQNQTFRSTTGIPGCISKYMDAYFDMVGSLLISLTQETDAIMSIARAFFDLDVSVDNKYNQGNASITEAAKGVIGTSYVDIANYYNDPANWPGGEMAGGKYRDSASYSPCATIVSTIIMQAGLGDEYSWALTMDANDMYKSFKEHDQFVAAGDDVVPEPGSVIFIGQGRCTHTAIVESVDPDGTIHVIDNIGSGSGKGVTNGNTYKVGSTEILGYGTFDGNDNGIPTQTVPIEPIPPESEEGSPLPNQDEPAGSSGSEGGYSGGTTDETPIEPEESTTSEQFETPDAPVTSEDTPASEEMVTTDIPDETIPSSISGDNDASIIPDETMPSSIPGDSDASIIPDETIPSSIPGDNDVSIIPDETIPSSISGDNDASIIPDETIPSSISGDNDASIIPDETIPSSIPGDSDASIIPDETIPSSIPGDSDASIISDEQIISGVSESPSKGKELKNIGLAALGAATVAGTGYAGYRMYENIKEKQDFDDDKEEVEDKRKDYDDDEEI